MEPLRERLTARILLFDADGRILLMRGRFRGGTPESSAWFTVGGGVDPGETLEEAARREIAEETGFTDVELGPVVWLQDRPGTLHTGEKVLFKESFLVARCAGGEPCRDGWADYETDLTDDMRWWSLDEIAASAERIYPERFVELVPAVASGDYPETPLVLTVMKAR